MRYIAIALLAITTYVSAQEKTTPLVKIGKSIYTMEEFDFIYNKNSASTQLPISKAEYLELFVNYKLKVEEARAMGYDTLQQYKEEVAALEKDLATPYLMDSSAVTNYRNMLKQRMDEEIDASHILIEVKPNATAEETLAAYKRAEAARARVISGEDFKTVATEVSEDPSAKVNGGRLGYFSALRMVTEFEDMAYATKVNDVTEIFRTSFGWHFMKVHDRRPYSGKIQVAHIMKILPRNAPEAEKEKAMKQIDSLYTRIVAGEDFAELAMKSSDDRQSATQGGMMPWFGKNEIVHPFGEIAFSLKNNGDVSRPFATPFGLHIVKRLNLRTTIADEDKELALNSLMRNRQHPLSTIAITAKVQQLTKSYNYRLNDSIAQKVNDIMVSSQPDSVKHSLLSAISEPLAFYNGGTIKATEIEDIWQKDVIPSKNFASLNEYVVLHLEQEQLSAKNPEFRYTMQEYKDGFLVFEINQKYIWKNISSDTTALVNMYENNKERYAKDGSFEGDIYFFDNEKNCKKATKNTNLAPKLAVKTISGKQVKGGKYDDIIWPNMNNKYVLVIGKKTNGETLPYDQVKGQLIADYHQRCEKEYIESLRKKYAPKLINKTK